MTINDDIMQLIIRHLSQTSSDGDDLLLQEWLQQSPENRAEFEKIQRIWNTSGPALSQRIDVDHEWEKFRANRFSQKKAVPKVIRLPFNGISTYAAAAVILIGLFVGIRYLNTSTSYTTGSGQRLLVTLEDGTEVILGENSALSIGRRFNGTSRKVELEGEGFFSVAKNPEKPFEIEGPLTTTRVLGTAFQLVATNHTNFVEVSEGKVAYWSRSKEDTLILTQGEKGSLQKGDLLEEADLSPGYDSWKSGVFVFENHPVTDVLTSLQDYYIFDIANLEQFKHISCRFSGKFQNQELREVLDELSMVMGMEYTLQDSTLQINRFYCN